MNANKILLSDIKDRLKSMNDEEIENLWCDVCGDNPRYDKGGYGD